MLNEIKKCKPVSRVLLPSHRYNRRSGLIICLVPTSQSGSISLPAPMISIPTSWDRTMNEPLLNRGLFDLSTRKVCHAFNITVKAVSSYLTFSPFPRRVGVVCFLWHCLYSSCCQPEPFPLGSTLLYVARTFLPD